MKHFLMILGLSLSASSLWAAPPQDLSVFPGASPAKRVAPAAPQRLKESHLTSGAPPKVPTEDLASPAPTTRYDVICRESQGRAGKAKVKLSAGAKVIVRKRENGWSQVSFSAKEPPCWVPSASLL